MAAEQGSSAGTILMAYLLGAVTGAAVALLVAPAAGADTRRFIGDKAREGKEKAAGAAKQGREFVERQRDTIAAAVERGKEAYQEARGKE